MKLLFDLQPVQPRGVAKRDGGGRHCEAVFRRMAERGGKFSCYYDSKRWFSPDLKAIIESKQIPLFDISNQSLQELVDREHFDRLYSCLPRDKELFLKNVEIFVTIHGIRGAETPFDDFAYFSFNRGLKKRIKWYLRKATRNFKFRRRKQQRLFYQRYAKPNCHVITVSEHSKYAMQTYFPEIAKCDVRLFYSPDISVDLADVKAKNGSTGEKYFLCVSGNRWEKNVLRAIIAFDKLKSFGRLQDFRMKVTGATKDEIHYRLQNPSAFDFLGYVSDEELEKLYAASYLFVFPSINEGFGFPPIEAMKYSVPVIASPISALAETCGSGALFFNPFSIEEIMNRMLMMTDPQTHDEFARLGHEQYLKIKARQERDLDRLIEYITS